MKKFLFVFALSLAMIFQFCTGARKARLAASKTTYTNQVQPIIAATCSPCHIPPGGNKKALNTYTAAKENIDSIIVRINKNPNEKGFMPFKHPKLPDSTIQVFVKWKADGLPE
jgi:hypothetical protein